MLGIHDLPLFIFYGLLLNITPGQDFAYIASRGATLGWHAGAMAALGVGMLLEGRRKSGRTAHSAPAGPALKTPLRVVFRRGFLTNALNPKVALFFLAFLPQFVDRNAAHPMLALLVLGAIFTWNGTLWNLFVAWSASRLAAAMQRKDGPAGRAADWCRGVAGVLFIGLGLKLALSELE